MGNLIRNTLYGIAICLLCAAILWIPYTMVASKHKTTGKFTYTSCEFVKAPETQLFNEVGVPIAYKPYVCKGTVRFNNVFGLERSREHTTELDGKPDTVPFTLTKDEYEPNPDASMFAPVPAMSMLSCAILVACLARLSGDAV